MITAFQSKVKREGWSKKMTLTQKRFIILLVVVVIGIVLGRLAVRAVMNTMMGGTLFGGNFL